MHKERRQSTWIDFAAFAVVLCFFLFSAKGVWKKPTRFTPNQNLKNEELKDRQPQRNLAATSTVENINGATQTLNIGCLDKTQAQQHFESRANYLSVVAEICNVSEVKNLHRAVFRNEMANDEILAFIEPGSNRIKTSYFPLRAGENKISMEVLSKKGRLLYQSLEIIRNSENK